MSWNYRIVRLTEPDGTHYYEIREAYYKDGVARSITATGARPGGACLTELRKDLTLMEAAFNQAPLDERQFKGSVSAPTLAETIREVR